MISGSLATGCLEELAFTVYQLKDKAGNIVYLCYVNKYYEKTENKNVLVLFLILSKFYSLTRCPEDVNLKKKKKQVMNMY